MFSLMKLRNYLRKYFTAWKTKTLEAATFTMIVLLAILVYYYATFVVLPVILVGCSTVVHVFMTYILPNFLFFGVFSNMILIQVRDSSIQHKFLIQPVLKDRSPPTRMDNGDQKDGAQNNSDSEVKERTKFIGQHFVATPFADDKIWHICASCEVFVPPRAWHCHTCKTCILRRDHHCILTMGCIGEENHCNFIGLLLYLAIGCSISAVFSFIYHVYFLDIVWWMYLAKCFVPFYTFIFDFSITNVLAGITLIGQFVAWGMFSFYMYLAFRGQTCADFSKGILRTRPGGKTFSFTNLRTLLGPNPFLRILWPYHQVIIKSIDGHSEERVDIIEEAIEDKI